MNALYSALTKPLRHLPVIRKTAVIDVTQKISLSSPMLWLLKISVRGVTVGLNNLSLHLTEMQKSLVNYLSKVLTFKIELVSRVPTTKLSFSFETKSK